MVSLLCSGETCLEPSDLDAPHADGSANYTIAALRRLAARGDDMFCIVGADSFLDLRRWREPEELLRAAEWIVVSRPGFSLDDLGSLHLSDPELGRVHLLMDIHVDISATEIRAAIARGEIPPPEITESVREFIMQHHLYSKGKR